MYYAVNILSSNVKSLEQTIVGTQMMKMVVSISIMMGSIDKSVLSYYIC